MRKTREARSPVFFDLDDFLILMFIVEQSPISPRIIKVKNHMNLSHNSLVIHLRRLKDFGWIKIFRGENEDYKKKYVEITLEGVRAQKVFNEAYKISKNKDDFENYYKIYLSGRYRK